VCSHFAYGIEWFWIANSSTQRNFLAELSTVSFLEFARTFGKTSLMLSVECLTLRNYARILSLQREVPFRFAALQSVRVCRWGMPKAKLIRRRRNGELCSRV
jgi:hypothetical protein